MKVLLLSDEDYAAIGKKLPKPAPLKLPAAEELHDMARAGQVPPAFTAALDRIDASTQALGESREQLYQLIRSARRVGVKTGALVDWTGYSARHVLDIGEGKQT